jgi:hypothetical protein
VNPPKRFVNPEIEISGASCCSGTGSPQDIPNLPCGIQGFPPQSSPCEAGLPELNRGRKARGSSFYSAHAKIRRKGGKWQEAVLFLKKKNQKSFCPFAGVNAEARTSPPASAKGIKVFLLLFSKKEDACLPATCLTFFTFSAGPRNNVTKACNVLAEALS